MKLDLEYLRKEKKRGGGRKAKVWVSRSFGGRGVRFSSE